MRLTPNDWAILWTALGTAVFIATEGDRRWIRWARRKWKSTVGAWFTRRRMYARVGNPDEHSKGIMNARRDINCGSWS